MKKKTTVTRDTMTRSDMRSRDKSRLDWLSKNVGTAAWVRVLDNMHLAKFPFSDKGLSLRRAIDAAMKADKARKK